jgi:hypothetical protein
MDRAKFDGEWTEKTIEDMRVEK